MIYFFTPIHAAGATREDEIVKFKVTMQWEIFALKRDVKTEDVAKVLAFYSVPWATVIAKRGSNLRKKSSKNRVREQKSLSVERWSDIGGDVVVRKQMRENEKDEIYYIIRP